MSIVRSSIVAIVALAGAAVANATDIVGVTVQNNIVTFNQATPGTLISNVAVTGLNPGEQLLEIDMRPATGEIFGITSDSRVTRIDPLTGIATPFGASFAPGLASSAGTDIRYSIDFNPTVDRIRVVGTNTDNRRLNPNTGGSVSPSDTLLTIGASTNTPFIASTAYSNSLAGVLPGSTRQFVIDSRSALLGEVGSLGGGNPSFNGGVITFIGNLGFSFGALSSNLGFDIFGPTGEAFVSVQSSSGGVSSFGTVDLGTGAFTAFGNVGGGVGLRSLTAIPTPGAAALLGLGGLLAARRRR